MELGYSFCPNDTFIFWALTHGKVPAPQPVDEILEDVETLNEWADAGRLDLTKVSYAQYARVSDRYVALRAGGALGRGVGPLLVAREPLASLAGKRVAVPGLQTTAYLLLSLAHPEGFETLPMRYDEVMPAVLDGRADAGLIIHESRFTYARQGLTKLQDLGEWWEGETGQPIPLGCILARRSLGEETLNALNAAVRASLDYAWAHPEEPRDYIRAHALEMEDPVMDAHINLYVNDYSRDVGDDGQAAVEFLFARAREAGLLPACTEPLFAGTRPEPGA
ncbi:MAG TPA: 1,4-dihydroxy-6-naphthoate synthase [Deinococcales bacterium]|nr:1,4-dihydroxy-6-naphthoate synthase [Deinococcales bacterium]